MFIVVYWFDVLLSIADKATVSGGYNPTGTVTFDLYRPNPTGSGTPLFTDTDSPLAGGTATSAPATPPPPPAPTTGSPPTTATPTTPPSARRAAEPVTITPATPGDHHQPAAGQRRRSAPRSPTRPPSAAAYNPTGTVTFNLF